MRGGGGARHPDSHDATSFVPFPPSLILELKMLVGEF